MGGIFSVQSFAGRPTLFGITSVFGSSPLGLLPLGLLPLVFHLSFVWDSPYTFANFVNPPFYPYLPIQLAIASNVFWSTQATIIASP